MSSSSSNIFIHIFEMYFSKSESVHSIHSSHLSMALSPAQTDEYRAGLAEIRHVSVILIVL